MNSFCLRWLTVGWLAVASALLAAAPEVLLKPQPAGGVIKPGEKIAWQVLVRGDGAAQVTEATYTLKAGGATLLGEGRLSLTNGAGFLETTLTKPGTVLAEVTIKPADGKPVRGLGGVAVAPEQIKPSLPAPDDFDAFWAAKLRELAAVPPQPELIRQESDKPGVDYWKLNLANVRGTRVRGQLARPTGEGKLPALLLVQYAGVYPLGKGNVTGPAADGWLTLNISAHDLPLDEPESFYQQQSEGALKNYTAIGNDDRERSYFLRMFLGCYRAADYLATRPDWDGRTLVVSGTSQGGLQAFVTAGLHPKVSGLMALVPAGCDNTGDAVGRKPGWPYWMASGGADKDAAKMRETSRYFDAVNFAARAKCPALVGLGLIDTTSPASGVYSAINQLHGPCEVVVLPESDHRGRNNTQAAYHPRAGVFRKTIRQAGTR
jgi:cephalosporin-C deacetylase-like acetyl esterase